MQPIIVVIARSCAAASKVYATNALLRHWQRSGTVSCDPRTYTTTYRKKVMTVKSNSVEDEGRPAARSRHGSSAGHGRTVPQVSDGTPSGSESYYRNRSGLPNPSRGSGMDYRDRVPGSSLREAIRGYEYPPYAQSASWSARDSRSAADGEGALAGGFQEEAKRRMEIRKGQAIHGH